jgi:dTDP-4-dehydrorhamnose reductase
MNISYMISKNIILLASFASSRFNLFFNQYMKLLITGSKGQLGWELCKQAKEQGLSLIPLDLPDFDITDQTAVFSAVTRSHADIVINAAAYTAVDKAESEPELAFAVNRDGPSYLAPACAGVHIPLIHISTDYVFDGKKTGPYLETDPVAPIGVYGKSKAEGEVDVRRQLKEHIILRTSWLCGIHGNNFVKTMLRLGKEREELRVVDDQHGCPTFAADLAEAILIIAGQVDEQKETAWGTYHYCGAGSTTWFGFASKIFEIAKNHDTLKLKRIMPITTSEYPTPAKRPTNSVLDCTLLTQKFNILQYPWEESLTRMLNLLFNPK